MIKSISHSNVINNHWNWASKINFKDFENFHIEVTKHGFTHVDAPSHMIKNGKSLSDCKPNLLCGWAKLIDVSECLGDKPITSDFLESKAIDINQGDIVILRSNLNDIYPNTSSKYWDNSPYLDDSGSKWLIKKNIKSLVFDFPQDRAAKDLQYRVVMNKEFTEHQIVLGAGVMHVEHAINLKLIEGGEIFFCALPLHLPNADGGNCTPISIIGIEKKEYEICEHSQILDNNKEFKSFLTLSFEKGDQVQETGFIQNGITHTSFIASNHNFYKKMFEKLIFDNFVVLNNTESFSKKKCEVLILDFERNIELEKIINLLKIVEFEVLCLSFQPKISDLKKMLNYCDRLFINFKNSSKLNDNSKIIFSPLLLDNSLISPSRIISIN